MEIMSRSTHCVYQSSILFIIYSIYATNIFSVFEVELELSALFQQDSSCFTDRLLNGRNNSLSLFMKKKGREIHFISNRVSAEKHWNISWLFCSKKKRFCVKFMLHDEEVAILRQSKSSKFIINANLALLMQNVVSRHWMCVYLYIRYVFYEWFFFII